MTRVRCVRKLSTGRGLDCGSRPHIARVRLPQPLDSRNDMAPQGGRVAEACAHGRCAAYRTKHRSRITAVPRIVQRPIGRGRIMQGEQSRGSTGGRSARGLPTIRFPQQGEGIIGSTFVRTQEASAVLQNSCLSSLVDPYAATTRRAARGLSSRGRVVRSTHLLNALRRVIHDS